MLFREAFKVQCGHIHRRATLALFRFIYVLYNVLYALLELSLDIMADKPF